MRNRTVANKAVTNMADHDMAAEDFVPLWSSYLKPTVGPIGGYELSGIFNFNQLPLCISRMFKTRILLKVPIQYVDATVDLLKNFCKIMRMISADLFTSRKCAIPHIVIFKGIGQFPKKHLAELNSIRGWK